VQEAYFELTRQKQLPGCVAAWLYRVVRNKAINMSQSAQRRRRHETLAAALVPVSTAENRTAIELEELVGALQVLDESQREVIIARFWGGLGFEQIAEVVGTSVSTAHRRYESGLKALRERLNLPCPNKTATCRK
jgi:RNA polymerase sigma-70 factor (ECF subfamily)